MFAYKVQLSCGHFALFFPEPRLRDKVYCRRCEEWWFVSVITTTPRGGVKGRPKHRDQTVT
jgi:hypothetical protein